MENKGTIKLTKDEVESLLDSGVDVVIDFLGGMNFKITIEKEKPNEDGIECSKCSSYDLDIITYQEFMGESGHGGYQTFYDSYICNKCGHKESL